MAVETVNFCPLGKECESIVDGKIHKCMWHVKLVGQDPQTGEEMDQWGCAMAWQPLLIIENSRQQRSTAAGVESLRNEVIKVNTDNQQLLVEAAKLQNAKLITG